VGEIIGSRELDRIANRPFAASPRAPVNTGASLSWTADQEVGVRVRRGEFACNDRNRGVVRMVTQTAPA
jgi:hypothetical protein